MTVARGSVSEFSTVSSNLFRKAWKSVTFRIHKKEVQNTQDLGVLDLTWAHPIQVLEVKPWGDALVDGECMPRLKVNGKPAVPLMAMCL